MARTRLTLAVTAGIAVLSVTVWVSAGMGTSDVDPLLRGVNFVPTRSQLDSAANGDALPRLIGLADGSISATRGVRLRSIRALRNYADDPGVASALEDLIAANGLAQGEQFPYLVASIDALGNVAGAEALPVLASLLNHAVLDVRFAAAMALAESGSPAALIPLRNRLQVETEPQVRFALMEAIRALAGP